MHVGRTALDRLEDDEIDEVDEGGLLRHAVQILGLDGFDVAIEDVVAARVAAQALGHARRRRAVLGLEELLERLGAHPAAHHRPLGQHGHFVRGRQIERVEHHHHDRIPLEAHGHEVMVDRLLGRHDLRHARIDRFERFVEPLDPQPGALLANVVVRGGLTHWRFCSSSPIPWAVESARNWSAVRRARMSLIVERMSDLRVSRRRCDLVSMAS